MTATSVVSLGCGTNYRADRDDWPAIFEKVLAGLDRRSRPRQLREPGALLTAGRRRARALGLLRIAAGLVFLAFGIGKFTSHASELASFKSYGLPFPEVFVYAIGVLEVAGGALLVLGLHARLVALPLAGDMVGAIAVSGVAKGEVVSLTLAPALLVVLCLVMAYDPPGGGASPGR